jgi:hypothetical protein
VVQQITYHGKRNALLRQPGYAARFHKELLLRDAKQFIGLTACQAPATIPLQNPFNASLTAVSFAKLETPPPISEQPT